MAEFFPREPDEIWPEGADRPSNEPELVFRRHLEVALADRPWLVLQNLVVQAPDRVGCREIDFLVIDPERGFIVIEVKGGDYRHAPDIGWFRQVDGARRADSPGVAKQASGAMFHLVRFISSKIFHPVPRPPYHHGWLAALVDAEVQQSTVPPEAEGHVLDAKHCRDPKRLHDNIEDLFAALGTTFPHVVCGPDSCMREVAERHLLPAMRSRLAVRDEIRNRRVVEYELLRPVRSIVDAAHGIDRLFIEGYPGTGKTFAALHRAARDLDEGRRTLVLCHNIPLAASLTAQLRAKPVRAETTLEDLRGRACVSARFFALAAVACAGHDELPPASAGAAHFDALADGLAQSAARGELGRFDSIVVDEGQDFSPSMMRALDALADRGARVAFFQDPNQRLYASTPREEIVGRLGQPLVLRENLRNSHSITEFLRALDPARLDGLHAPPSARTGQEVVVWEYPHAEPARQIAAIERIVRHLHIGEDVRLEDIAILSPFRLDRTALAGVDAIAGVPVRPLEAAVRRGAEEGPCLRWETLHRFKGLEAPVVILHDVAGSGANVAYEALLTACSRAQHALYVLRSTSYAGGARLPVQGALPS
jgi:hypothetical protein